MQFSGWIRRAMQCQGVREKAVPHAKSQYVKKAQSPSEKAGYTVSEKEYRSASDSELELGVEFDELSELQERKNFRDRAIILLGCLVSFSVIFTVYVGRFRHFRANHQWWHSLVSVINRDSTGAIELSQKASALGNVTEYKSAVTMQLLFALLGASFSGGILAGVTAGVVGGYFGKGAKAFTDPYPGKVPLSIGICAVAAFTAVMMGDEAVSVFVEYISLVTQIDCF